MLGIPSNISVQAERSEGEKFIVTTSFGKLSNEQTISIPDNAVLTLPAGSLAVARLKPGRELYIKTVDPLTMRPSKIIMRGLRHEEIRLSNGDTHNAMLIETEFINIRLKSWMGENGDILRQETLQGWVLEKCSEEDADQIMEDLSPQTGDPQ